MEICGAACLYCSSHSAIFHIHTISKILPIDYGKNTEANKIGILGCSDEQQDSTSFPISDFTSRSNSSSTDLSRVGFESEKMV
jgi:hypothetical protein